MSLWQIITTTTFPGPYNNGLWKDFVGIRSAQLFVVCLLGVLLTWPASDWRLPLVERFTYEVTKGNKTNDTVLNLKDTINLFRIGVVMALAATSLGFIEVQQIRRRPQRTWTLISLSFGFIGLLIHVYLVYYQNILFSNLKMKIS